MHNTSRGHIVYQILDKDNWEVIDEIDSFLTVYDGMPTRMKLIVDLKMTGETNKNIAKILNVTIGTITKQLNRAKQRIIKSIF